MARRAAATGGRPSQRQLRVAETIRHVLAELLLRDATREPLLSDAQLTVSEVRISPDLRHAEVFVTELGGDIRSELLQALGRAAPSLRGEVARRMRLKRAPELVFRPDTSFAEAAKIEALLARERAIVGEPDEDDDGAL